MKRQEGHIGLFQGVILVYAVLASRLFIQFPAMVIGEAGPAAWQATLVMTVVSGILFLPAAALAKRFPEQDLRSISTEVLGPFLGGLLSLLFAGWFFTSFTIGLRIFTETFIIALLPTTPPSVLAVVALLCVMYAVYRGLEPLARATQVLFPVIVVSALAVLVLNLPRTEASRLYPFWGYSVPTTMMVGLRYGPIVSEALILLVAGYSFRKGKGLGGSGLWGICLFGLTATLTFATLIAVFGAPDAAQQPFPLYNLARLIYLGRFFQRVESILVMFWFFTAAVRLSVLFYAGVVSLGDGFGLPLYRPLIFPAAVITLSFSLLPKDFVTVIRADNAWGRLAGLGALLVPCLLLLVAAIRKKGGQTHAA